MSCRVQIKAPFFCLTALEEALKKSKAKNIKVDNSNLYFYIDDFSASFEKNKKKNYILNIENERLGNQFIESLIPVYEEEYKAFLKREAEKAEAERIAYQQAQKEAILEKARQMGYRTIEEQQGKEVKLVLCKAS